FLLLWLKIHLSWFSFLFIITDKSWTPTYLIGFFDTTVSAHSKYEVTLSESTELKNSVRS
ncbi:hypothetical protein PN36_32660, partial [Candidatus Thiomargarita nelsonii]